MMTSPTVDDLLEGFIVALQNEIMPHVGSPKAYTMCQMLQSLIQEVRQVVPVYDTYVAEEHNGMTRVLRETAAVLGSVNGPEADRIRSVQPHWARRPMCQCRLTKNQFVQRTVNLVMHCKIPLQT